MGTIRPYLFASAMLFSGPLAGGLEFAHTRIERIAGPGDTEVSAVYSFKNAGDSPVTVLRVDTSCDCTAARLSKTVFSPGETGEIALSFRFGDREGTHTKVLTVHTDEPGHAGHRLWLQVEIPVVAEVKPRLVYWRGPGPHSAREISITNSSGAPLRLVDIGGPVGAFRVDSRPLEQERGYTLAITPGPAAGEQSGELLLTLETTGGRRVTYRVFLRCFSTEAPAVR